ncbi:hypothetical protein [Pararhodospirillum oryzae]|uniref:hypothetical protein n=1 Tax=Pararhodospirillum oryzae TaxID=478448 RepID=UPI001FE75976|nr:hypothetical protein [Pararhodospirillum oryzae]
MSASGLGACERAPAWPEDWTPSQAWLQGPPEPMQVIDASLSRLLVAVPPERDRGLRYLAQPGRAVFVQKLDDGAILYARYAGAACLPPTTPPDELTRRLYQDALARRVGVPVAAVRPGRLDLPFGPAWTEEASGPLGACIAFLAPLRVGKAAPAGTSDALVRGAWCQPGPTPPRAELTHLLRSLVLRE